MHGPKKPRKVVTFGWSTLTGHEDNGHNDKLVGLLSILVTKQSNKYNKLVYVYLQQKPKNDISEPQK